MPFIPEPRANRVTGIEPPSTAARRRPGWPMFAAMVLLAGCAALGGGDRPARLDTDGAFRYPPEAKAARIGGRVEVAFDITADGRVSGVRVLSAQPAATFDAAAIAYIAQRRYLPALRDGRPVTVRDKRETIRFVVDDGEYPTVPPNG